MTEKPNDNKTEKKKTAGGTSNGRRGGKDAAPEKPRRRINPASCTVDELLTGLGTHADTGLSPKEAARRLSRDGRGDLFRTTDMTVKECLLRLMREPVLWLFLAVCVVALFFDRAAIGLVCLALTLIHSALTLLCIKRAAQIDAAMQAYDRPLTRVVRGGITRRVSADGLVKGDVILLSPGDIVPADARILSVSGQLVVTERELDGSESRRRTVRLSKDPFAAVTVTPGVRFVHSPENMVFAGGIVESGECRAVCAAVGGSTHLGGLFGGLDPAHPSREPGAFRKAERWLGIWNLILVVAVIPLVIIGLLTFRGRYELLTLMLSALSLCVISLTGRWLALGVYAGASLRDAAASARDADDAVNVKNFITLDALSRMDELVLIGTAALHDGVPHPDTLTLGCAEGVDPADGSMPPLMTYDCRSGDPDESAQLICEGLYLVGRGLAAETGERRTPPDERTASLLALIDTVTKWSRLDTETVTERVSRLNVKPGPDGTSTSVTYANGRSVTYRLARRYADTSFCTLCAGRRYHTLHPAEREAIRRTAREAELSGRRVLFLLSVRDGQDCLEGMLILSPLVCPETRRAVRSMEASGVRVTCFLRSSSNENTRVLSACGLTDKASADRPVKGVPRTSAAVLCENGVRAFEGCTTEYIADYIAARRASGRVVGVLSGCREDLSLIGAGDVAMTVSPDLYLRAFSGSVELTDADLLPPDGGQDSRNATDLCRRRADVIVRRSGAAGGGVSGVREALRTAARYRKGTVSTLRYLFISHVVRLLCVLIGFCSGLVLIGAPLILLSGLGVDLLAAYALMHADGVPSGTKDADARPLPPREGMFAPLVRPLKSYIPDMIAAGLGALSPWIVVGIARLLGADAGGDLSVFMLLSLVCVQFAVFLTERRAWNRTRVGLWTIVAFLCVWVGTLAVALSVGLHLLWALVLPLVGGAVFAGAYCAASLFKK